MVCGARKRGHQLDALGTPARPQEPNLCGDVVSTGAEDGLQETAELGQVHGARPRAPPRSQFCSVLVGRGPGVLVTLAVGQAA